MRAVMSKRIKYIVKDSVKCRALLKLVYSRRK